MNKFDIKDKFDSILYTLYNLIADILFNLDLSSKKLIKQNIKYRNKHESQRCFIMGTGPSLLALSKANVNALSNEIIIGTNSLYKAEIVSSLTPTYYSLVDDLYRNKLGHTFDEVFLKYKKRPPIFITDYRAAFTATEASPNNQHIFIYSKKYPTTQMRDDLDTNIYAAMNVVSYSILVAMFMGFKRIYLLGCDYNAFCTDGKGHAYDDRLESKQVNYNLAFYLKFYWITTEFHYLIARLARKKKIEIVNLTPNSLLDAYPSGSLDQLF